MSCALDALRTCHFEQWMLAALPRRTKLLAGIEPSRPLRDFLTRLEIDLAKVAFVGQVEVRFTTHCHDVVCG